MAMRLVGLLFSPAGLGGLLAALAGLLAVAMWGDHQGSARVHREWQAAELAEMQRQAGASAGALKDAAAEETERQLEIDALTKEVADYEAELATRPAAAVCTLSDADARRLSGIR